MSSQANHLQNDKLSFAPESVLQVEDSRATDLNANRWKLMIIDDDQVIHDISHMVLKETSYQKGEIEIIDGFSGEDARRLLQEHPDTAVILLDVVMETDHAGLDVVKYIREELDNQMVRIILRTGQPGQAPEKDVITQYDINDYKEKSELTAQKLHTTVISSLRNYHDLKKIQDLVLSKTHLEDIVAERTQELETANQNLLNEVEERTQANIALSKSETRLAEAQRIAKTGHWEWQLGKNTFNLSQQARQVFGLSDTTIEIHRDDAFLNVSDHEIKFIEEKIESVIKNKTPYKIEHRILHPDGSVAIVQHCGEPLLDASGKLTSIIGTVQDITAQYKANEEMRKLSGAIQQTADAVMITNCEGIIEYVNPAFEEMTGYSHQEAKGHNSSILKSGKQSKSFYQRLWKIVRKGEIFSDVIINRRKDGGLYYEEKTIAPLKDGQGVITHYIATGRDITDRMEAQQRLFRLAHHDALTGLPNRALLQDRLSQALTRTQRHKRFIAVMFLDMDRFKVINDTLGHDIGDALLQAMAERLIDCVREGDTVARLGGDEFAIILNDVAHKSDVTPIANKILTSLAQPFRIDKHELFITTSIGITLSPEHGSDTMTLLKKADTAMYRAKAAGKNNAQFYTNADDSKAVEKLALETALRRALKREEFHLHYQPQIDVKSGKLKGVEALLRWRHEHFSNVSPMHFIPLLEETGLIIPVGEWVLETACRQIKQWHDEGHDDIRVAVNISGRQFQMTKLEERVDEILRKTGAAAECLELEITEGLLIDNIEETAKSLHQLHRMGISISIDDFGTGYSSMGYLKNLPIDVLKIDRSFVVDITNNPDDEAIASGMIHLAHSLGMKVIAEGVEDVDQLELLKDKGCDLIQGYLFSRPLPPEKLTTSFSKQNSEWLNVINDLNKT